MTAKSKQTIVIRLSPDLKDRFENLCEGTMNAQLILLIRNWTEAREAELRIRLKPEIKQLVLQRAIAAKVSPEIWIALLIQSALRE
jgi:hypothetical protein